MYATQIISIVISYLGEHFHNSILFVFLSSEKEKKIRRISISLPYHNSHISTLFLVPIIMTSPLFKAYGQLHFQGNNWPSRYLGFVTINYRHAVLTTVNCFPLRRTSFSPLTDISESLFESWIASLANVTFLNWSFEGYKTSGLSVPTKISLFSSNVRQYQSEIGKLFSKFSKLKRIRVWIIYGSGTSLGKKKKKKKKTNGCCNPDNHISLCIFKYRLNKLSCRCLS